MKDESADSGLPVAPLSSAPPPEKWDDWVELDARSWPARVEKHYAVVPTTCFNCEAACGLLAYVDKADWTVRRMEGNPYHPASRGRTCAKGPATVSQIRDPERARRMPPVVGKVEFRHVTLEYVPGTPVLQDVSLTVEPGTFAALVGPSGAGKSSLLYLLLRLFEFSSGDVLVDGSSVRDVRLRSLLDQMGVVLQETFLYGGTVRDNLRYGNLHATAEQTEEAVRLAGLEEFVAKLPHGLDTHIGEGTRLSGGERQRLGLARALIRDPRILILDEPTAFLDSRTETSIMETFRQVMKDRTTLMVSHRLVPVRDADTIYVFRAGRIVEQGVHDDLVRLHGLYHTMWQEQTKLRGLEEQYGG